MTCILLVFKSVVRSLKECKVGGCVIRCLMSEYTDKISMRFGTDIPYFECKETRVINNIQNWY
jgi:hypothetical protein